MRAICRGDRCWNLTTHSKLHLRVESPIINWSYDLYYAVYFLILKESKVLYLCQLYK